MPVQTLFEYQYGRLDLRRYPEPRDYSLQAFNAADAYLLDHFGSLGINEGPIWILNDTFGALSLATARLGSVWIGQSWTAREAMKRNAAFNELPEPASYWIDEPDWAKAPKAVLMQIPKDLDLLKWQLNLLMERLPEGIPVMAGGMTRNIHMNTIRLFESLMPDTHTTIAVKKARLILATSTKKGVKKESNSTSYVDPQTGLKILSYPGVFSADHPDPGSVLLTQKLPIFPPGTRVLDLGCGNGFIMASIAHHSPGVIGTGCDDTILALKSTRATLDVNGFEGDLRHGHATADLEAESMDVVVCNPPFHQDHARLDQIAFDMFAGSKKVLRSGGQLWVVGNRNLGYHIPLSRLFGKVEAVGSDPRYTVFRCTKR
jgi:16S rRNA (guanine1207-N2)-methyltransferase